MNQTKISALLDPFPSAVLFSRNLVWAAYIILNFLVPTFKKKKAADEVNFNVLSIGGASLVAQTEKNQPAMQEM